jgi:hypothetical protein
LTWLEETPIKSVTFTGATTASNTAEQISTAARMYLILFDMPWVFLFSVIVIHPAPRSFSAMPIREAFQRNM